MLIELRDGAVFVNGARVVPHVPDSTAPRQA
jgi:hypothetical protein